RSWIVKRAWPHSEGVRTAPEGRNPCSLGREPQGDGSIPSAFVPSPGGATGSRGWAGLVSPLRGSVAGGWSCRRVLGLTPQATVCRPLRGLKSLLGHLLRNPGYHSSSAASHQEGDGRAWPPCTPPPPRNSVRHAEPEPGDSGGP